MFTSREIASVILSLAFVLWVISHKFVRASIIDLLKKVLHPKVFGTWILLACHVVVITFLLFRWGYSYPLMIKDVIMWYIFSGVSLPARCVLGDRKGLIRSLFKDSIGFYILFEFLVSNYTFHLLVELPLVLIVTIVVVIGAYTETKKEYEVVSNLIKRLQVFFGLAILGMAVHHAFFDSNIWRLETILQLLLPVVLILSNIPFVYFILIYASYEGFYIRIGFRGNVSAWIRHYGSLRILWKAKFRPSLAQRYFELYAGKLLTASSKEDVDRVLQSEDSTI